MTQSKTIVVTGSNGLIGSEIASYFDSRHWRVVGVDHRCQYPTT